jgi:hypothetical protein
MSNKYSKPSLAKIKDELHYDSLSGVFTWKVTRNRIVAGQRAGTLDAKGYRRIRYRGDAYFAHHLAFYFEKGRFSSMQIDHINGARDDNRIANLREATQLENSQNQGIGARNTTGFLGVTKLGSRFVASVKINGTPTHLGVYDTANDAHEAYVSAKAKHHKFFNANRMMKL